MDPALDIAGYLKNKLKIDRNSPISGLISLAAASGNYYIQTSYNTEGLIGYNGTNFGKITIEISNSLSGLLNIEEDYTNNKIKIVPNVPSSGKYALTCSDGKVQWTEISECEDE